MKLEPSADMRQAAHGMREWYVALTDEGFSSRQALTLLGQAIAAGITAAHREEGEPDA